MLRNVLSDTVNWQTRKQSNFTKFLILVWTTISSKRRNGNQLENGQSTSRSVLCFFFLEAEHLFQSVECARNKHQYPTVLQNHTKSEIISVDAGLRVDGLLALDLWDIVIEVLAYNQGQHSTQLRKLGQINPNHTSSKKLAYVNPTRQTVVPKPRPTCQQKPRG